MMLVSELSAIQELLIGGGTRNGVVGAEVDAGALMLSAVGRKPPMSWMPPARTALRAVGAGTFVTLQLSGLARSPILSDFDVDGRPRYLEAGLRSTPRVP